MKSHTDTLLSCVTEINHLTEDLEIKGKDIVTEISSISSLTEQTSSSIEEILANVLALLHQVEADDLSLSSIEEQTRSLVS